MKCFSTPISPMSSAIWSGFSICSIRWLQVITIWTMWVIRKPEFSTYFTNVFTIVIYNKYFVSDTVGYIINANWDRKLFLNLCTSFQVLTIIFLEIERKFSRKWMEKSLYYIFDVLATKYNLAVRKIPIITVNYCHFTIFNLTYLFNKSNVRCLYLYQ